MNLSLSLESSPRVAILDYGMGNLRSVTNAFRHAGGDPVLAEKPEDLKGIEALVFPGQGAIMDCMVRLRETGFDRVIRDWIASGRPFFGICLGLQALFEYSEEGNTPGLGIYSGRVMRFRLPSTLKIPHMGWNTVHFREGAPLMEGLAQADDAFYFVHSYHVVPEDTSLSWCEAHYGDWFCAGIARGNCFATQFHPEKSQSCGLRLYHNFLELTRRRNSSYCL